MVTNAETIYQQKRTLYKISLRQTNKTQQFACMQFIPKSFARFVAISQPQTTFWRHHKRRMDLLYYKQFGVVKATHTPITSSVCEDKKNNFPSRSTFGNVGAKKHTLFFRVSPVSALKFMIMAFLGRL